MPHIFVTHGSYRDFPELELLLGHLASTLPVICAENLSSEDAGGDLTKDDFSVTFHETGPYDIVTHLLQIRIEAHSFPLRLVTVDERTERIRDAIKLGIEHRKDIHQGQNLPFYVWVRLSPAGFSAGELNPI